MSRTEPKLDSAEALETRTRCQPHSTGRKSIGCTDRFPAAQMCFARPCIKSVCIPSSRRRKAKSLKQKQSFRYFRLRYCHRCTMLKSHVAPFCAKWFKVIVLNVWTPGRYACSSSVWFWPFQWPSECQQDCKGPGLNICGLQDFEPLVKFSSYLQASILFPFEGPQAKIHRGRKCSICQRHLTPDSWGITYWAWWPNFNTSMCKKKGRNGTTTITFASGKHILTWILRIASNIVVVCCSAF